MAVTSLPQARARRTELVASTLPPLALLLAVLPLAFDLFGGVHAALSLGALALVASVAAVIALGVMWLRHPRTSWLAAAVLAALASVALRLAGADVAPALSLLAVLSVGVGGAFASRTHELHAWLELQPSVARR